MVYGIIRSVQAQLKYRGGWKGLWEHMYTVSLFSQHGRRACERECPKSVETKLRRNDDSVLFGLPGDWTGRY